MARSIRSCRGTDEWRRRNVSVLVQTSSRPAMQGIVFGKTSRRRPRHTATRHLVTVMLGQHRSRARSLNARSRPTILTRSSSPRPAYGSIGEILSRVSGRRSRTGHRDCIAPGGGAPPNAMRPAWSSVERRRKRVLSLDQTGERFAGEQFQRAHEHALGAETALQRYVDETRTAGVFGNIGLAQGLNRVDRCAVGLDGQDRARLHGMVVEMHCARAALGCIAPNMCALTRTSLVAVGPRATAVRSRRQRSPRRNHGYLDRPAIFGDTSSATCSRNHNCAWSIRLRAGPSGIVPKLSQI